MAPGLADGVSSKHWGLAGGVAASFLTAFSLAFGEAGQVPHPPVTLFWPPCCYLLFGGCVGPRRGAGSIPSRDAPWDASGEPVAAIASPMQPLHSHWLLWGWDLSGAAWWVQLPEVLQPRSFAPLLAQGLRGHSLRWWQSHRGFAAWHSSHRTSMASPRSRGTLHTECQCLSSLQSVGATPVPRTGNLAQFGCRWWLYFYPIPCVKLHSPLLTGSVVPQLPHGSAVSETSFSFKALNKRFWFTTNSIDGHDQLLAIYSGENWVMRTFFVFCAVNFVLYELIYELL